MGEIRRGIVGIPATDHGRWSAFRPCLQQLVLPDGWEVKECHGASEPKNRHEITRWALQDYQADAIYWLDDDLLFRPNVLLKMLERPQPIVAGLSLFRRPKDGRFLPIWSHAGPESGMLWDQATDIRTEANGLMRLGAATVGGLLVRREVFDAIGEPYWRKHPDDPFETSADIDFCWRAHRAGFTTWGNPDVVLGHMTHVAIWPRHREDGSWSTVLARGFEAFSEQPWPIAHEASCLITSP